MEKYNYKDLFEYELVQSKRKTIGIVVKAGGAVTIKAPSHLSVGEIERCIEQKKSWILDKIHEMELQGDKVPVRTYQTGETLYYLGQAYQLIRKPAIIGRRVYVRLEEKNIVIYGKFEQEEQVKQVLEAWYQQKAAIWMTKRLNFFKEQIGVEYKKVSFRSPKTRWGSCSTTKNIMLNWKLIMAPAEIIDYVICHELCHLLEMNHSSAFWLLVEKQIPDWQERRGWLKENGMTLVV